MPTELSPCRPRSAPPQLHQLGLLRDFTESNRKSLEAAGNTFAVEAGTEVIAEGAAHGRICIVLAGRFVVSRRDSVIAELGVGQLFGEMEFLNPPQSVASVNALTDATVWRLSRKELRDFMLGHPEAGSQFLRLLATTFATRLQES